MRRFYTIFTFFLVFFFDLFSGEILIFHHIPKCGGTTATSLIAQNFHLDEIHKLKYQRKDNHLYLNEFDFSYLNLEKIKYISGHVTFRSFSKIPHGRYFTFLRDPVERVFSHYRFCLENMEHPPTFSEFYEKISNLQVRYFSTLSDEDPTISLRQHLESAKKNLKKYFFFVGITEEMSLSIATLFRYLEWEPLSITPIFNTTANKDKLDPELLIFVKKAEWADLELYEYGKKLFNEHVKISKEKSIIPKQIEYVDFIHFTIEQPLDGEGWGYREIDLHENRSLRQSYLKEAFIRFPLARENYQIEFLACSPLNSNLKNLKIFVNGKEINIKRCSNKHWSKFKGVIPKSLITEGKTKIIFKVPKLYVPSDHTDVPDHRCLGVGISEIIINPI